MIIPNEICLPGRRRSLVPFFLVAAPVFSVLASLNGCKPESNAFAPPPPPAVTVAHPVERPVTRYLESTGTTEAFETLTLRARVPGFLEDFKFKPGAAVKNGELLFVIDKRTYQATFDRVQAQVLADEASYKAAESDAKVAEELAAKRAGPDIDRIIKAGKRDAARAQVEASKAALETARLDLQFCEVRATINGRITKNLVDRGNLVGAAGQPTILATIVNSKPLYVYIDASERDRLEAMKIRMAKSPGADPGQVAPGVWHPVDLAITDEDQFKVHGHIDYVDPIINPQTGTIRVRCRFENEDETLLPGMFVRLRVLLDAAPAMLVPNTALLSNQSGRYALVVNEKDVIEVRQVKTGALDGSMRVVLEGLSRSDRVVVNGLQRARPGATVAPTLSEIKPDQPAATTAPAKGPSTMPH